MTWSLIPMPAPEELVMGYTPAPLCEPEPALPRPSSEERELRHYFITLFATFGLLAGLQSALADHPTDGQRRLAEVHLAERKNECRACSAPAALMADADQ